MKQRRHGWTLIEVLVSTSILAVLVVVMAEGLNTTQRSLLASRSAAERQQVTVSATRMLREHLSQATLQTRPSYDTSLNRVAPNSDLHFVCGPATELMTGVPGVCGDAVFFQRPGPEGSLQRALQACGFFVQYGGDEAWRPSGFTAVPAQKRFRLLLFHQPAGSLTMFQPSSVMGEPSRLSQLTRRPDLYQWFVQPINDTALFKSSVSVVAENVLAMIVQTSPLAQRCHDTRRYQWEAGSTEAALSRNQMPDVMEVTLVMVDEAGWARLAPGEADALAAEVMSFVRGQTWQGDAQQTGLNALQRLMEGRRMVARMAVITVGFGGLY